MNANQIRQLYLDFQRQLGHSEIHPAPLVLENDPTTLFTGSGMQPLLPYLLGQPHPEGTRLANSQPCLRLQDIEDIGDPRHTTVFEMLGNWSLGDYFKEEQIRNYFKFLTEIIGLDPEKIYVTCFIGSEKYQIPRDQESADLWQKVFAEAGIEAKIVEIGNAKQGDQRGINPGERIFFYDDKENWWSRGGGIESTPIGDPCGPDSEVFYDFGEDKQDIEKYGKSHPASDGARFMEIGNQVFMQYRRNPDGSFSELKHKNVDFGGGLERLAAAKIGSFDVFRISSIWPIIEKLSELSGRVYESETTAMRIIADHLRGSYLLAAQGLIPSNKTQGYALRRLIRRALLKAESLGLTEHFSSQVLPIIANIYADLPDYILTHRDQAIAILEKEERTFRQTLVKGLRELAKQAGRNQVLTGADLFKLQDTYGFPLELSVEAVQEHHYQLEEHWRANFDRALAEQRNRSQTASKGMFKGGLEDHGEQTTKYHTANHLLLAALQQLIDPNIIQQGSNITAERLRFDFKLDRKLQPEEIKKLEDQVNQWITDDLPVNFAEYDKAYAKNQLKAHGQFWDKYPEKVKVYTVGDPDNPVSREVCGGPHVERTGTIGHFKIQKEESSSAGVRRIKAILQ